MRRRSRGPGVDAEVVQTFDDAASGYDNHGPNFARPVATRLVSLAELRPGQRVLDAGCGAGAVLIPAATAVSPAEVTGIDLAPRMLTRAATEAAARGLSNIRLQLGDAADPPFRAGSFDAILASLVLYLLPNPQAAVARWFSLLAPGGTLGFSWGVRPDPRWSHVFTAVETYARISTGFESLVRRLGTPNQIQAMLARRGYTQISTATHTFQVRYTSPQQWWAASWAEGPRLVWHHIPEASRDTARQAAFHLLAAMKEPDGSLIRRIGIGYAIAHRPGAAMATCPPAASQQSPDAYQPP